MGYLCEDHGRTLDLGDRSRRRHPAGVSVSNRLLEHNTLMQTHTGINTRGVSQVNYMWFPTVAADTPGLCVGWGGKVPMYMYDCLSVISVIAGESALPNLANC